MKFKIDGDLFKKATSDVKTGLGSKKSNAFYETIYIEALQDKVVIRTQDEGIRLTAVCATEVAETGSFRCEGKLFIDIVGQLNGDENVEVYTEEKGGAEFLHLKQRGVNVKIKSIEIDVSETIEDIHGTDGYTVEGAELSNALSRALTCVSKENNRPLLKGINIAKKGDKIFVASLDGFKVSKYAIPVAESNDETAFNVTIPTRAVPAVVSLCNSQKAVKLIARAKLLVFVTESGIVESSLLDGEFFNYASTFPVTYNTQIKVPTKDIKQALSLSLLTGADAKNNRVELRTNDETSELVISTGKDEAESDVTIPYETLMTDGDKAFYLNGLYLLDCLKADSEENIVISIVDSKKPVVFCDKDSENAFLLLPIRVTG